MDCANSAAFAAAMEEAPDREDAPPAPPGFRAPETELEFLMRRGMEESRLAKTARTAKAAAAHSYLASAYSAAISQELAKQAELEMLLLQIR